METSLIELKENDSLKTTDEKNGEYSISLKKNLTLNNGDELVIKNVFIDTIASSGGLIVLEEDTTATISFCRGFAFNTDIVNDTTGTAVNTLKEPDNEGYRQNLNIANRDIRHGQCFLEREADGTKRGDGFVYYQLEEKTVAGGNNFIQANNIRFVSDISSKGYSGHYGGVAIAFAIKGLDGKVHDFSIQLLNSDATESGKATVQPLGVNSFVYDTSWKGDGRGYLNGAIEVITSEDTLQHHNLSADFDFSVGATPIPAGDIFNLKQEQISFTIQRGAYDPNDLARIITDNCVKIPNPPSQFDSTDTQVFPFSSPLYGLSNNDNGTANIFFLSSDSEVLLNLNFGVNNRPVCGCNQFSFIFDEDTRTFKFVSLHTPYFVDISSGGQSNLQIGTKYSNRGNDTNDEKVPFMDTKRGDIIIMGLSAVDENGGEVDFWFGKLGLNPNILATGHQNYQDFKYQPAGNPGTPTVTVKIPSLGLENGVDVTDAFIGADAIMPNNIFVPTTAQYTAEIKFANLMTTPIFGLKTLGQITDTQGYFLIEISGFNNDVRVIGESDIGANISAIVSRYYASTAYTNGYIQDAISYIHKGDPITLSDFKIRILDPGHQVSTDIGNDSSVFLMINRATPIAEPAEEK